MFSGDDRDRTGNLLVANQVLSQLSYVPSNECDCHPRPTPGRGVERPRSTPELLAGAVAQRSGQTRGLSGADRTPNGCLMIATTSWLCQFDLAACRSRRISSQIAICAPKVGKATVAVN